MTNEEKKDREHQNTQTPVVDPNAMTEPEMRDHIDSNSNAPENSNTADQEGVTINENFADKSVEELELLIGEHNLGRNKTLSVGDLAAAKKALKTKTEKKGGGDREAPPKDHKMRDNEQLFKEEDIIEFMFREWYMASLDWAANKALNTLEVGLVKLFDKPEKPDPAFSNNVGNSDHAAFVADLDTYINKRQRAIVNRLSAPEADRKKVFKAFKMKSETKEEKAARNKALEALNLSDEHKAELASMSPKDTSDADLNKKIYEMYRDEKIESYIKLIEGPEDKSDALAAFKMSSATPEEKEARDKAIEALTLTPEHKEELANLPSGLSDADLNKKINKIYSNDEVYLYAEDFQPTDIPSDYMSNEMAKAFERQLKADDNLTFDDKKSILLTIVRAESSFEIGKLKATGAKIADKHRNGSSKYNDLDFNDKEAVAAMFMEEGQDYHDALIEAIKKDSNAYLNPRGEPSKMEAFGNIANDAFDREQNIAKGNKGWFDDGINKPLKKLHKDLKLSFNIKKQAKDDNTTLVEGDDGLYKGYKEKNMVLQGMKKLGLRRAKAKRMRDLIDGKNQEIITRRQNER